SARKLVAASVMTRQQATEHGVPRRKRPRAGTSPPALHMFECWLSDIGPARRRLLAGVECAALLAGARLLVVIERLIERRQIADQMRDLHLDAVHQVAAFEAVPVEGVELVRCALRLD